MTHSGNRRMQPHLFFCLPTAALSVFLLFFSGIASGCKDANAKMVSSHAGGGDGTPLALTLFGASGARLPTEQLCNRFEQKTGVHCEQNFASSGTLARQIASGAPAEIFVSANQQWIEYLITKNMVQRDAVFPIAANSLVLIAPKDTPTFSMAFSADFPIERWVPNKIAVGDPNYVPVGKYTQAVFNKLGWQKELRGKMILAKDVTSVLHYVSLGEVDLGVVYRTEALASKKVNIVGEVPPKLHPPIIFYGALLNKSSANAKSLHNWMKENGSSIFQSFGFLPLD